MSVALQRRADVYVDGEMQKLAKSLRAFRDAVTDILGPELTAEAIAGTVDVDERAKRLAAVTAVFSEHVRRAMVTTFLVGHAAGFVDKEKPPWLAK